MDYNPNKSDVFSYGKLFNLKKLFLIYIKALILLKCVLGLNDKKI